MVGVSFEELLAVLLGLVGSRLTVAITTAEEPAIMVGNMAGILRAGTELDAAGEEAAVFFVFADGETGFILAREYFESAAFHRDNPSMLVVRLGVVTLWIEQEPEQ
jgi:hypothetical protein